jgi:magnesium transporter
MLKKHHHAAGASPGTLLLHPHSEEIKIRATRFNDQHVDTEVCRFVSDLTKDDLHDYVWIDVCGVGDGTQLKLLAERYQISPLGMEDLVNGPQRPKEELFENHHLVITHGLSRDGRGKPIIKQLGLVVGKNYVLTFHHDCEEFLEIIHQRLENPKARLRRNGPDYLAYAILDAVVDGYYPVLEDIGETIESLEQGALRNPQPTLLAAIHTTKNQLGILRRSVWPQREMIQALLLDESVFIHEKTREFLRDTLDHSSQLADIVDMYRDSTSSLVNTYMSAIAHRSNEIMKVLTLMTSVFVPPTFIAGVYGMNFSDMPELNVSGAYPVILFVMVFMIMGMLWYFRRRGWLGSAPISDEAIANNSKTKARAIVLHHDQDEFDELDEPGTLNRSVRQVAA